jgi:hypothetical protein
MQPLSASALMNIWDEGCSLKHAQLGLLFLGSACPGTPPDELANVSIGVRDRLLLQLREQIFGSKIVGVAECLQCGERLEITFKVDDVNLGKDLDLVGSFDLSMCGYEVRFRLPTSLDLIAISDQQDIDRAKEILIERCVFRVNQGGQERTSRRLPDQVLDAVIQKMADIDLQGDVRLALTCPGCGRQRDVAFDIVSFFWKEIDAWAKHLLEEVHVLASAYGWSEAEILALSSQHRQLYLNMVNR